MEQLIMRWENDGTPTQPLILPEGIRLVTLPELEDGVEKWLDIMQYGLSDKREDTSFYKMCMLDQPNYKPEKCFFILYEGKAVASITVICNPETKEGLIHMVGSLPECRGKGIGNIMGQIGIYELKTGNMQTALLKTDDFRIPAILVYLKMGFTPVLSNEDFTRRWSAIYEEIGYRA